MAILVILGPGERIGEGFDLIGSGPGAEEVEVEGLSASRIDGVREKLQVASAHVAVDEFFRIAGFRGARCREGEER